MSKLEAQIFEKSGQWQGFASRATYPPETNINIYNFVSLNILERLFVAKILTWDHYGIS